MSSTVFPIQDKENPSAVQGGARIKQHPALASNNAFGTTKKMHQKNTFGPSVLSSKAGVKTFGSSLLSSKSGTRSFGDISNRVSTGKTNIVQGLKQPTKIAVNSGVKAEVKTPVDLPEPEYMPIIKEEEDYSDIFPPSLHLTDCHINRLVNFWEMCRKPEMSELDCSLSPQLKPKELKFYAPLKGPKIVPHLEPIDDELLDLPPPAWN